MRRLLLAVAVIALLASGCGSVDRDPNLAQAVEKTEATGSSSFALDVIETDLAQEFRCEGAADYATKRMRLECGEDGEFIAIGDVYYARGWSVEFGVPPDRPWIRIPIEGDDSPHDFAPATLLAKLRAASIETERLSEEEVRGEETARYRMTVTCSEVDLACPGETAAVEVWIDGDGLVRRVTLQDGSADVTAEFFDFGRSVDVESPPESQVADIDNPRLEPCPGGGSPISDAEVRRALRLHEFEVNDGDAGECYTGVAATVAGILNPTADAADSSVVICYVYASDLRGPARVAEASRGGVIGLQLRNVACSTIESRSEAPAVVRLHAALEDLE